MLDDRSIIEQIIAPWAPPGVIVRPLDPLLPVDVPVSPLRLTGAPLPEAVPQGRPFTWSLAIEGQGLSARGIRRWLDEALRDTGSLRIYPPQVRQEEGIDPDAPLRQRVSVRLTLKPRESGYQALPDLALPYVDPTHGQFRLARLSGGRIRVEHPLWLAVRPWLPWVGGILLLPVLALTVRPHWQRGQNRRRWLRRLRKASDPHALRRAWHAGASPALSQGATTDLAPGCRLLWQQPLDEASFQRLKAGLIAKARQGRMPS